MLRYSLLFVGVELIIHSISNVSAIPVPVYGRWGAPAPPAGITQTGQQTSDQSFSQVDSASRNQESPIGPYQRSESPPSLLMEPSSTPDPNSWQRLPAPPNGQGSLSSFASTPGQYVGVPIPNPPSFFSRSASRLRSSWKKNGFNSVGSGSYPNVQGESEGTLPTSSWSSRFVPPLQAAGSPVSPDSQQLELHAPGFGPHPYVSWPSRREWQSAQPDNVESQPPYQDASALANQRWNRKGLLGAASLSSNSNSDTAIEGDLNS